MVLIVAKDALRQAEACPTNCAKRLGAREDLEVFSLMFAVEIEKDISLVVRFFYRNLHHVSRVIYFISFLLKFFIGRP